jgi:hypothetical protein
VTGRIGSDVAVLPARSVTWTVPVTVAPSPVSTMGLAGGPVFATPDSASLAVNGENASIQRQLNHAANRDQAQESRRFRHAYLQIT